MAELNYFDLGRPLSPLDKIVIDTDFQPSDVGHLGRTPPRSPADRLKHLKKHLGEDVPPSPSSDWPSVLVGPADNIAPSASSPWSSSGFPQASSSSSVHSQNLDHTEYNAAGLLDGWDAQVPPWVGGDGSGRPGLESRTGSSGGQGGRNEGAIAPWLTDDVETKVNHPAQTGGMSIRGPPRHPSYPTLPTGSSAGLPSSTSSRINLRQKSLNVPFSNPHVASSTLTTIAASPPGSSGPGGGSYMQQMDSGSHAGFGGKGRKKPTEMTREGSYSSQNSAGGTMSNKLYRASTTASLSGGRSSSRDRQGSDDSSTLDGYGLESTGSMVGTSTMASSVSRLPPVSPSGAPSVNGAYRDLRSGSQVSLGSTSGQHHYHQQLWQHQRETSGTHSGDKKKGLSALTGLLKRKGGSGGRPSTGGSDGAGQRLESQASPGSIGPTSPSRPARPGRPGSANDAVAPAFGSTSGGSDSVRARRKTGHNPSVISLATSVHAPNEDVEKSRHSLGRGFLSKARKPSKKPASEAALEVSVDDRPKGTMYVLDTDLDDMRGIVRPHQASLTPSGSDSQSTGTSAGPGVADWRRDTMISTASSSSYVYLDGRPVPPPTSEKGIHFRKENPFSGSGDSVASSNQGAMSTPPSPFASFAKQSLTSSARGNARRPSQLRNVKSGSVGTDGFEQTQLQPLDDVDSREGTPTVFNEDPFGAFCPSSTLASFSVRKGLGMHMDFEGLPKADSLRVDPRDDGMLSPGTGIREFNLTPLTENQQLQAAWTAPESWGVEGDQVPVPEDDPSSDEVEVEDAPDSPEASVPTVPDRPPGAPHAFGSKPAERRTKIKPGSSAKRPATGSGKVVVRPTTSGSTHAAVNHFIRIYNLDTTFSTLTFPLTATVQDILAALEKRVKEGKLQSQAAPGNMKLYIRERGQDRLLMPHEKPLAIQLRRLLQAGYNDADRVDEMGRENLAMLCRFIYQPPILPIIDPEDEGSYESFELVDLGGRDLQAVPIFLYRHAHSIISLNLSRNPMTDLPLDFIQACSTLRELRMTHMALKRVPPSIRQSCAITRLDLSCNRLVDLEHAGLHEISTLVSLKVQNNRLNTLPASFRELKGLKYLNISNNKFVKLPTVICDIHNLVDLDVSFNEIESLPAELGQLSHLERLVAVGNSLVTFPDSFSTLASLRELDVRRNALTNLNAVYTLPNLAILQADNNNLVVLDAQLGPKVREFGVPHNSITRFTLAPLSASASAYSLSVLDLSYAKLSTLAEDALAQLVNLHTLNLNYNKFVRLPETLENLGNLRHLSCTDNVLTVLPSGIGRLQNLQVLNVHNNNLKELPSGIWQCKSLRELNASSNLLEAFPETPFSMLDALAMPLDADERNGAASPGNGGTDRMPLSKSLRKLLLCDNQLDEEIFDSVSMLEELRVLNLSFNDIYEVPTWTISKNQRLEELYLSGNNLTSLPSEDLERLTSLRVIHVNGNKLQTLPAELGKIRRLVTLDVGSNVLKYNIANWPYDWNWNWNLELRYLNLSGNKRLEIKPSAQHELAYSGGLRRDLSDFSKLSHLRVLGLMDVTLRIPSLPDENEHRRVRTSFSDMNGMGYGISDTIGQLDELSLLDLVVPDFRSREDECLFGMFGLAVPSVSGGRVPKFVQEWMASNFHAQIDKLKDGDTVEDALRRTFLLVNKNCFDSLVAEESGRKDSGGSTASNVAAASNIYTPLSHQYRSGAAGAVVYVVGRTLHVANAGGILAVISCKGEAELLSAQHDPFDKEETQRIRAAEAWVSPRGLVNDEIPMSRGFGFFNAVPAVNSLPQVSKRGLTDSDEFVILANRALWDCCSYQTAVDIARTVKDDPMMAAQKLRDFAISYGSEGSIMIMVLSVADLFRQRPMRSRAALPDKETLVDGDGHHAVTKRVARRRIEDIGDRTLLRLQQEVEPPIGQVAMVFTDIKNSTSLWETNPGMQTAMRMHNSLLRRQLRIIGGYEVKTEGDAFMVSFPSVTSAILWCFTCQLQLLNEDWPREILESEDGREVWDSHGELIARGLSVRMGIHWGNPVWEKDPITRRMDYFGPMVNKSARVSASADGGQIMVSSDVHKEVQSFKTFLDEEDDVQSAELQDDLRRETTQLRKIGLGVLEMGKKKLKGLEVPEKLFLIYPRSLSGRLELSAQIRKDVETHAPKVYGGEDRIIDIDELRQLVQVCLRLEAVAAAAHQVPMLRPTSPASLTTSPSQKALTRSGSVKRTNMAPLPSIGAAAFLGPRISEEMSDEELVGAFMSITGRIENSISTLTLLRLTSLVPELAALNLGFHSLLPGVGK